eukprot:9353991-Heterocapsa_arctica.AAC.1
MSVPQHICEHQQYNKQAHKLISQTLYRKRAVAPLGSIANKPLPRRTLSQASPGTLKLYRVQAPAPSGSIASKPWRKQAQAVTSPSTVGICHKQSSQQASKQACSQAPAQQ